MKLSLLLMNNLYFLKHLEDEQGKVIATIKIQEDHKIFQGHFPGNPVLPGVCLVQILKELMVQVFNRELLLIHAGNIKYLAFINPLVNSILHFEIQYKHAGENEISCSVRVYHENTNFCSFKGVFSDTPSGYHPDGV